MDEITEEARYSYSKLEAGKGRTLPTWQQGSSLQYEVDGVKKPSICCASALIYTNISMQGI